MGLGVSAVVEAAGEDLRLTRAAIEQLREEFRRGLLGRLGPDARQGGQVGLAKAPPLFLEIACDRVEDPRLRFRRGEGGQHSDPFAMAANLSGIEGKVEQKRTDIGPITAEIGDHVEARGIDAERQAVGLQQVESDPDEGATMAVALVERGLGPAHGGQRRARLIEDVVEGGHDTLIAQSRRQCLALGVVLGGDQDEGPVGPDGGPLLPNARPGPSADAAATGQEAGDFPAIPGRGVGCPVGHPEIVQRLLEHMGFGRDFACEQKVLGGQECEMVVVEGGGHAVIGECQECGRAATDLPGGYQMRDQRLEECLVRDPGRGEETQHVTAAVTERQYLLDRRAAQAEPLGAYANVQIGGHGTGEAEALLEVEQAVKELRVPSFVDRMSVDQTLFPEAGLDPAGCIEILTFDMVQGIAIQDRARLPRRRNRTAIP